jgi:hypothetical protein
MEKIISNSKHKLVTKNYKNETITRMSIEEYMRQFDFELKPGNECKLLQCKRSKRFYIIDYCNITDPRKKINIEAYYNMPHGCVHEEVVLSFYYHCNRHRWFKLTTETELSEPSEYYIVNVFNSSYEFAADVMFGYFVFVDRTKLEQKRVELPVQIVEDEDGEIVESFLDEELSGFLRLY